jgi:threonine synthase
MDIQISSNFERLIFDAGGRKAEMVCAAMANLKQAHRFELTPPTLDAIRAEFKAGSADVDETAAMIGHVHRASGYLLDPHTAIGVHVARSVGEQAIPMVVLGTAHPAKFPDAVEAASGVSPALPGWIGNLMERKEHFTPLPSDLKIVEDHIFKNARAAM